MKLWLARRFGGAGAANESSATPGHALSKAMNIESIEHVVRNRVRTFLRHTWLVTILGTVILGAAIWGAIYFFTAPTMMRIAAGPAESANVKLVQLLAQKFATEHDKVQLELVPTAGAKESAQAIRSDRADLAILPSTIGNSPDWPIVAILRQNVLALVVPAPAPAAPAKKEAAAAAEKEPSTAEKKEKSAKSGKGAKDAAKDTAKDAAKDAKTAKADKGAKNDKGTKSDKSAKSEDADAGDDSETADAGNKLEKVSQLAGHRVGIVTGNVATTDLLNAVLDHYGVPQDKVQISMIDPKNIANAVKANQVDVLFVAGSATGQAITDTVAASSQNGQGPSFIAIDQADGIAKRNPAFEAIDIDAGTFGGNPPSPGDTLKSLSFAEYLVAQKSFSHEAIGALTKLIYTSRLALAAAMPGEIKIKAPSTDKDAGVVVHSGALAYLTDDQKSFFDKYGDTIFYGMLIFPVFGSAIAGVASYFRSSGRTRRLRLLQKLIDLVRKAHAAPSLEALDQMQLDLDHVVVAITHQSEHEEYDQTVQMSFSLVLDQVRFAIAARRAALIDHPGADAKPGAKAAAA
jgi:TRAP-type uncharacterized transport system substrate-binding protein